MRSNTIVVILACVILGFVIGLVFSRCFRCAGVTSPDLSKKLLKVPQVESSPSPSSSGTSTRRRASTGRSVSVHTERIAGPPEVRAAEGDSKDPLPKDVFSYIAADMRGVSRERLVLVTKIGTKFRYHVNCCGLRTSTTLSLMDIRKCEGLSPCSLCTGSPCGRV